MATSSTVNNSRPVSISIIVGKPAFGPGFPAIVHRTQVFLALGLAAPISWILVATWLEKQHYQIQLVSKLGKTNTMVGVGREGKVQATCNGNESAKEGCKSEYTTLH